MQAVNGQNMTSDIDVAPDHMAIRELDDEAHDARGLVINFMAL